MQSEMEIHHSPELAPVELPAALVQPVSLLTPAPALPKPSKVILIYDYFQTTVTRFEAESHRRPTTGVNITSNHPDKVPQAK